MIFTDFLPGYKFKVRDDFPIKGQGRLMPNSKGFIAYSNSMFGYNKGHVVSKNILVLTRKGKKGKSRLEILKLNSPLIYDEKVAENEPEVFKNIYKQATILKTKIVITNTLEMSNLSFIAWCTAYRLFIIHTFKAINYNLKKLPKRESHPFNIIKNVSQIFQVDQAAAEVQVSHAGQRVAIIKSLRSMEELIFNQLIKNILPITFLDERPLTNLLNFYTHVGASQRAIKEAEALKYLIKRDGLKAIEKHIDF